MSQNSADGFKNGFKNGFKIPLSESFSQFEQRFLTQNIVSDNLKETRTLRPLVEGLERLFFTNAKISEVENNYSGPLKMPVDVAFKTSVAIKDIAPFIVVGTMAAVMTAVTADSLLATVILSTEALFYAYCMVVASFKFTPPVSQTEHSIDRDIGVLWHNILTSVDDPRIFFSEWFFGIDFDRIRQEDAYEVGTQDLLLHLPPLFLLLSVSPLCSPTLSSVSPSPHPPPSPSFYPGLFMQLSRIACQHTNRNRWSSFSHALSLRPLRSHCTTTSTWPW